MKENRAKRALKEGKTVVGHMITEFGTRGIAKLAETANPDYVTLDMEHTGWGIERVSDVIAWFKATDIPVIVRVPENQYHFLNGVLDAGASGIQIPHIESAEDAKKVIRSVRYPPLGDRGLGLTAAHSDFRAPKPAEYFPFVHEQVLLIAQVESAHALDNLEAIAAVDGVDVLLIGHNDLSHSLGIHGQFSHPKFQAAAARVERVARENGKVAGIHPLTDDDIDKYSAMGFRLLIADSDVVAYKRSLTASVDNIRARVRVQSASRQEAG